MSVINIKSLPPEVAHQIVSYLQLPDLFAFSRASRSCHTLAFSVLHTLNIGVYHSRICSVISAISRSTTSPKTSDEHIALILSKREARDKQQIIRNQTKRLVTLLMKYERNLRHVEISAWALEYQLADVLAGLPNLRSLKIQLDHPHVRHPRISRSFWEESPPSTSWNAFTNTSKHGQPPFGRLEELCLERSGITDHQLLRILQQNLRLKSLRLQKCLTLTDEFFEGLATSKVGSKLEHFTFTKSTNAKIDDRILHFIGAMTELKSLNLHGCRNLDSDLVQRLNDSKWRIKSLVLPHNPDSASDSDVMEVDPEFK